MTEPEKLQSACSSEENKNGDALTDAMSRWIKEDKATTDPKILLKAKPFDWGPHTNKISKEVDKILYGSK